MSWRISLILAIFGLIGAWAVSRFQNSPGYMDADYYFAGGMRLAGGYGFSEKILWNYLDDPEGLPHPSHAYWMPLTSLVAAAGMVVVSRIDFTAARYGFLLLAACIPPLTAAISWKLTRQRGLAMLAGLFAVVPVFYLPYLSTTDSFGISMLLGGLFFYLLPVPFQADQKEKSLTPLRSLLLGLLCGILHLTRAEGGIWLLAVFAAIMLDGVRTTGNHRLNVIKSLIACLLGYLLVMGPWFVRNQAVFGTFLSPAGVKALWIREYNDLYIYPAGKLNFGYWWQSGMEEILRARFWAAGQNLQTVIGVQGEIFLLPLILVGMWRLRGDMRVRLAILVWFGLFLIMTLIFPFQGARGGFFHAGAALQPLFWAAAPLGLEYFLEWGAKNRGWQIIQARKVFTFGALGIAALLSIFVARGKLFSGSNEPGTWDAGNVRYSQIERILNAEYASSDDVVVVNNAPGYFVASGRSAISIPYTDFVDLCKAAERYEAGFLLLEIDQIQGESGLYHHPEDRGCLAYLETVEETRIYRVREQ